MLSSCSEKTSTSVCAGGSAARGCPPGDGLVPSRCHLSMVMLVWLIGVLLSCLRPAQGDSCSAMPNCTSCASTTTCHWCSSDNRCHAIGSPYGCLYGVNCYDNEACVRLSPVHVGYMAPSASVIMGLLLFLLSCLLCVGACTFLVNEYINHSTIVRMEKDTAYQEMVSLEQKEEGNVPYRLLRDPDEDQWDPVPRIEVRRRPRFITIVMWTARLVVGAVVAALLGIVIMAAMYAPHMPTVNVCNTSLDWGSIMSGFQKLKLEADCQLLLSVYNPNRLSVAITSGQGVFKHDHTGIGAVEFPNFVIEGGAITDVLVTLVFTPSLWKSLQLDAEFNAGSLTLMVDIGISGKVLWNHLPVYPFSFSMSNYFVHVGSAGDRSICKCPGWG